MTFTIRIELRGKWYRMQVERYFVGERIQKFKVSAGTRFILLQYTQPEANAPAQNKIAWKVLEGEFRSDNEDDTALALQRIFRAIENEMKNA